MNKEIILTEDVRHGDFKTVSIKPEKYPVLKAGMTVKYVRNFINFYGHYVTVEDENGQTHDINEEQLEIKDNEILREIRKETDRFFGR